MVALCFPRENGFRETLDNETLMEPHAKETNCHPAGGGAAGEEPAAQALTPWAGRGGPCWGAPGLQPPHTGMGAGCPAPGAWGCSLFISRGRLGRYGDRCEPCPPLQSRGVAVNASENSVTFTRHRGQPAPSLKLFEIFPLVSEGSCRP